MTTGCWRWRDALDENDSTKSERSRLTAPSDDESDDDDDEDQHSGQPARLHPSACGEGLKDAAGLRWICCCVAVTLKSWPCRFNVFSFHGDVSGGCAQYVGSDDVFDECELTQFSGPSDCEFDENDENEMERISLYRSSCTEWLEDFAEDAVGRLYQGWSVFSSMPLMRTAGHVGLLVDVGTDIMVAEQLWASGNPRWSSMCFLFAVLPYVILSAALFRVGSAHLGRTLACGTVCSVLVYVVVAMPALLIADMYIATIFLRREPHETKLFHFTKLRLIVESVEGALQTALQGYILLRVLNPWSIFSPVTYKSVQPSGLIVSLAFSIKGPYESIAFVRKFAVLQAGGNTRTFLHKMSNLGDGLMPSDVFDAVVKEERYVIEYDLCWSTPSELFALASTVKTSRTLRSLTFQHSAFLFNLSRTTGLLKIWFDELLLGSALEHVEFDGLESQHEGDLHERVKRLAEDAFVRCPRLCRVTIAGTSFVSDVPADGLLWAAAVGKWPLLQAQLLAVADRKAAADRAMSQVVLVREPAKCLGLLLIARANPDAKDADGGRPLHRVRCGLAARLLLQARADVEACDHVGRRPLHNAVSNGCDVVAELLAARAEVECQHQVNLCRPLHIAAYTGATEAIRILLKARAELEAEDEEKGRPLQYAAWGGSSEALGLLLAMGAHLEHQDCSQNRALHGAAGSGSGDAVCRLVEALADLEAEDGAARRPLHCAVLAGSIETVRALLEARARPDAEDNQQKRPLHYAGRSGSGDVVHALLEATSNLG